MQENSKTFKEELKELCEKHGVKNTEANLVHYDTKDKCLLFISIGNDEYPATSYQIEGLRDALAEKVDIPCIIWNHTMTIQKVNLENVNSVFIDGKKENTEQGYAIFDVKNQ